MDTIGGIPNFVPAKIKSGCLVTINFVGCTPCTCSACDVTLKPPAGLDVLVDGSGTTFVENATKKFDPGFVGINQLNDEELSLLSDLLDYDDENLYKLNQGLQLSIEINDNKITKLFKNYKYENDLWRRD